MKNIFDYKRFTKILSYDIMKSYQNYGVSFLIMVFMPLLFSLLYGALSIAFVGEWTMPGTGMRAFMCVMMVIALLFTYAPKVYGNITDKRYGSEYLMIPASTFEKYLSMALMAGIIVPFLFIFCHVLVDALVVLFGLATGDTLFAFIKEYSFIIDEGTYVYLLPLLSIVLCINSLVYLLGSILFDKFKIGKTLLALFALQIVSTFLFVPIVSHIIQSPDVFTINNEDIILWLEENLQNVNLYVNLFVDAVLLIEFLAVNLFIYLRLRTLKH